MIDDEITEHCQVSIEYIPTGEQIRRLRRKLNLTQEDLADILWVKKLTVGRWESGDRICKGPGLRLINILNKFELWDKI
jgi:DNA-binding transcriptional regulator YiaG